MSKRERCENESVEADSGVSADLKTKSHPDGAREYVNKCAGCGPALEELHLRGLQELEDETAPKMILDLFDMLAAQRLR